MRFITGLLFTFICLLPAGSMAQNKVTLSGKVIDQHGTPIAQATIAVENTTSGTYTDDRGKYSLQVAPFPPCGPWNAAGCAALRSDHCRPLLCQHAWAGAKA